MEGRSGGLIDAANPAVAYDAKTFSRCAQKLLDAQEFLHRTAAEIEH